MNISKTHQSFMILSILLILIIFLQCNISFVWGTTVQSLEPIIITGNSPTTSSWSPQPIHDDLTPSSSEGMTQKIFQRDVVKFSPAFFFIHQRFLFLGHQESSYVPTQMMMLREDNRQKEIKIREYQKNIQRLQQELEIGQRQSIVLRDQLRRFQEDQSSLSHSDFPADPNGYWQAQIAQLKEEIKNHELSRKNQNQIIQQKENEKNKVLNESTQTIQGLSLKLEEMSLKLQEQYNQYQLLHHQAKELGGKQQEWVTGLEEMEKQLKSAVQYLDRKDAVIKELTGQLSAQENQRMDLDRQLQQKNNQINSLSQEKQVYLKKLDVAAVRSKHLESQLMSLQDLLKESQEKFLIRIAKAKEPLEIKLQGVTDRLKAYEKLFKEKDSNIQSLSKERQNLMEQMASLKQDDVENILQLKQQRDDQQQEITRLQQELEITRLSFKDQMSASQELLTQNIGKLETKVSYLENEVLNKTQQLQALEKEHRQWVKQQVMLWQGQLEGQVSNLHLMREEIKEAMSLLEKPVR